MEKAITFGLSGVGAFGFGDRGVNSDEPHRARHGRSGGRDGKDHEQERKTKKRKRGRRSKRSLLGW